MYHHQGAHDPWAQVGHFQGRSVNVKHGARRAMGKVGETKTQRGGILMYYYKFAVIG